MAPAILERLNPLLGSGRVSRLRCVAVPARDDSEAEGRRRVGRAPQRATTVTSSFPVLPVDARGPGGVAPGLSPTADRRLPELVAVPSRTCSSSSSARSRRAASPVARLQVERLQVERE